MTNTLTLKEIVASVNPSAWEAIGEGIRDKAIYSSLATVAFAAINTLFIVNEQDFIDKIGSMFDTTNSTEAHQYKALKRLRAYQLENITSMVVQVKEKAGDKEKALAAVEAVVSFLRTFLAEDGKLYSTEPKVYLPLLQDLPTNRKKRAKAEESKEASPTAASPVIPEKEESFEEVLKADVSMKLLEKHQSLLEHILEDASDHLVKAAFIKQLDYITGVSPENALVDEMTKSLRKSYLQARAAVANSDAKIDTMSKVFTKTA
jgi:hypothetical protein